MSFKLVHSVLYDWDLRPAEKLVMIVLAEHANADHDWRCWPSVSRLSKVTGLSAKHVRRTLRALRDKGCISIHQKKQGSTSLPNVYTVSPNWCPQASTDVQGGDTMSLPPPDTMSLPPDTMSPEPVKNLVKDIFVLWNEFASQHSLPKVIEAGDRVPPSRIKHTQARLKAFGLEGFEKAFKVLASNEFFLGKNDRGWKVTFDYLVNPNKMPQLIERYNQGDFKQKAPVPSWKQISQGSDAAREIHGR